MSRDALAAAEARLSSLRLRLMHEGLGSAISDATRRLTARPRVKLNTPPRSSEQAPDEHGQFKIHNPYTERKEDDTLHDPYRTYRESVANEHRVRVGSPADSTRRQPRGANASTVRLNLRDGSTRTGRALSGSWLRSRRESSGLTVADLADRARLPAELIERAEADDPAFDPDAIRAQLEAALGDRA